MYCGVAWQRLRDPRQDRYFNVLKQAGHYDSKGLYVAYWLPALFSALAAWGGISLISEPSSSSRQGLLREECYAVNTRVITRRVAET